MSTLYDFSRKRPQDGQRIFIIVDGDLFTGIYHYNYGERVHSVLMDSNKNTVDFEYNDPVQWGQVYDKCPVCNCHLSLAILFIAIVFSISLMIILAG